MRGLGSLRARLLAGILLPITVFMGLGAWGLYRSALQSAHTAFDRQLMSAAHSIGDTLRLEGGRLSVSVPYAVLELNDPVPGGSLYYRITDLDGERLAGDEALPRHRGAVPGGAGNAGLAGLYEDRVNGEPVRVAVLYQPVEGHDRAGLVPVQVAEPLANRQRIAQGLLWRTLLVQSALMAAVVLVTLAVVNRALRPLGQLRRELDLRGGKDLAPLADVGGITELVPVVRALNELMARVRGMLGQQQRFVADAAHQLRTPLAVLQTQLQSGLSGDVPAAVLMQEMLGTVHRATALSQQLLSLARVEQLRSRGEAGACECGAAVREAVLALSPLVSERDLAFSLELKDDEPLSAALHPWLMGEVVLNLLNNAIRHAPRGSALGVCVAAEAGHVELVFWDQGPGIAPALRERVFEPFAVTGVVGGSSIGGDSGSSGTGLGLAICHAIVTSAGGSVQLDDHDPSAAAPGLRVTVALPLA